MADGGSTPVVIVKDDRSGGHGCLVTLLWFIFIGWWASGLWLAVSWFLIVLVLTMPIGLLMLNKVPTIATLRAPSRQLEIATAGGVTVIQSKRIAQRSLWLRAIYFVLVGWWFSFVWLAVAWLASLSLLGLPLTIYMYNRVPAVTTLHRF